jgi:hypothetical protein
MYNPYLMYMDDRRSAEDDYSYRISFNARDECRTTKVSEKRKKKEERARQAERG